MPTLKNILRLACLVIVAGVVAVSACEDSGTAPTMTGSIAGEVTIDGYGVDGVTVSLSNGATASTTSGSFRFDGIAPGTYGVSISGYPAHASFGTTSTSVTLGAAVGSATVAFAASNTDRDALVALYRATDGPNWTNSTNWLTDAPLGDWYGVTTDTAGRVVRLNLSGHWDGETGEAARYGLKGPIPGEVGNLTGLTHLILTWNELTSIPPELGKLANLAVLGLHRNNLSGAIPPELGNLGNLTSLELFDNSLTSIPPELGNLGKLRELWFGGNNLSGPIPPELGRLSSLRILDLRFAGVTGSIPPELGNLANLTDLWIDQNDLSGPIPPELGNLANLEELDLFFNDLSGPIPPELGNLGRLRQLSLGHNNLSGPIPTELGRLSQLQILGLARNSLSGSIPPQLGKLSGLQYLDLYSNKLSGRVPSELGSLTKLRHLIVHNNEALSDPLPLALEGLPLEALWYHNTGICVPLEPSFRAWLATIEDHQGTGVDCGSASVAVCDRTPQVRDEIVVRAGRNSCEEVTEQDLAGITGLRLSAREITTLKNGDFGGLSSLRSLWLHRNRLETLPANVFDGLSTLEELHLQSNQLRQFPLQVLDLTALKRLWLFGNDFPPGPVPDEMSRLVNMEDLHLGHLNLTEIPAGTFNSMENLRRLDLRFNRLTELPVGVFDGLSNLSSLYLWSNQIAQLPAGVFNSTVGYRLLHLQDNRGSPFRLALTPAVTGTVSGSGRLVGVDITEGAPFDIEVPLRASDNGLLEAPNVLIPAGERFSNQIVVRRASGSTAPVTLAVDPVPAVPLVRDICNATFLCYQGFEFSSGSALTLFGGGAADGVCDRTPQVRDALVQESGRASCEEVTVEDLAAIRVLDLSGPRKALSVADACQTDTKWKLEGVCERQSEELLAGHQTTGNANAPEIHALLDHDFEGLSALQVLYLQDNWLVELPEKVFDPLVDLRELDLRRNLLTSLPAQALDNLSSLGRISASANKLTGLPDGVFDATRELNSVDFSNNEMTALPDGVFGGLSNLGAIWFSGNQLTELPDGVFDGLSALRSVSFGRNRLNALPPGVFAGIANLQQVIFSGNELAELPPGIFDGLSALRLVDFGSNDLKALPDGLFRDQTDLRTVYFPFNQLEALPAGLLSRQAELQRVSFWNNRLTELPGDALRGLTELEFVDFDSNRMTRLPAGLFDGLSSLSFADFRRNPGSPFTLRPVPERRDNSDPLAPGPATVQLKLAEAAPFSMSVAVKAVGGASLSEQTMRLEAGDTESSTITVDVMSAPAGVVVDVPSPSPECDNCRFLGLEIGTGSSITLANPPEATVKIVGAYLTQAAQNLEGSVPLVASRDALLRVFATSDAVNNFEFEGAADFYLDGRYNGTVHLGPPVGGIPLEVEEGRLEASFNASVPGSFLRPGAEMVVVVRPAPPGVGVTLTDDSELRMPASGKLELDVREVAPLDVKVVPILSSWSKNSGGNEAVANFARDLVFYDPDNSLQYTRRYLPISELTLSLREAYYTDADSTDAGGIGILNELQLLRHLEAGGTDQYYHGLLAFPHFRGPGWGFGGIAANIPAYTALTISHLSDGTYRGPAFGETFAHELGHDVSLRHAPGCFAGGPDWNYPHDDAVIGVWGYDVNSPELGLKSPSLAYDYMSYCDPTWVSDYHFTKSLEFLSRPGRASAMVASRAPVQKTLVLWGSVHDGAPQLEPPLALDAPVRLPDGSGPFRIAGHDEAGRVLFSFDFTPDRTDHGGSVFVFAVPFEEAWASALDRVTLAGLGGSTEMDRRTIDQAAVLVDRSTGRIRSVVRDWTGELPPAMGSETALDVLRLRGVK